MTTVRQFGNFVPVTKQLIMYFEIRIQNYMPHMRFQERPYISQYEYQVVYHPPLRGVFFLLLNLIMLIMVSKENFLKTRMFKIY